MTAVILMEKRLPHDCAFMSVQFAFTYISKLRAIER